MNNKILSYFKSSLLVLVFLLSSCSDESRSRDDIPEDARLARDTARGYYACQKLHGEEVSDDFGNYQESENIMIYELYSLEGYEDIYCSFDMKTNRANIIDKP